MKNIANILTISRIILSVFLFFITPFSFWFYVIFSLAGFTDIIDGFIAKITNSATTLGARLDTLADFILSIFIGSVLINILNKEIILLVIVIFLLKLIAIIIAYIKFKKLAIIHTTLNKMSGFTIFVSILLFKFLDIKVIYFIIFISFITAVEEILISLTSSKLNLNQKSILTKM